MEPYWSDPNGHAPHSVKYESEAAVSSFPYCTESSLNFSTSATAYSEDDAEYATGRRNKTSRQDPLSHRIIEKRRRDRMNSCLADLSRLIPPQYQRKGRGRIEKTEIIEMAIRHLKHLQTECMQKENDYRLGYTECMKETAKFLYDNQMQELCYRLLARLQEHCDELTKNDCYRTRGSCHAADNVSASSGSPHQPFHPAQPICQLRDMLNASDIEHSNDHNDVKDLSFRNHLNQLQRQNHVVVSNGNSSAASVVAAAVAENHSSIIKNIVNNVTGVSVASVANCSNSNSAATTVSSSSTSAQPHQAAVITSTAPVSLHHHNDSSNHDFDSSHEPLLHTDTSNMHSPPPREALPGHSYQQHHQNNSQHPLHHHHHHSVSESLLRLRNFSESSHDVEHNNNYKYKNHIKERFNHELHDEETSSEHCPAPSVLQSEHSHAHSLHSEHSKDGTEPEIAPIIAKKRKLAEAAAAAENGTVSLDDSDSRALSLNRGSLLAAARDEKPFAFGDIKSELNTSSSGGSINLPTHSQKPLINGSAPPPPAHMRSFAVPIFALHGQGTYYVPLNVDYNALLPFLNGVDLLEKNYSSMPVLHPININVNFMPPSTNATILAAAAAAAAVANGKTVLNGNVSNAITKAKMELTNGW